jgi:23S rRNA G2445 N2-methylase RlmL
MEPSKRFRIPSCHLQLRHRAHGVGIDINPERIAEANENAKKAGVASLVRLEESDLFDADIHEASVVVFLSATLPGMA